MLLDFVGWVVQFSSDLFLAIENFFRQFVSIEILGYAPLWLVLSLYIGAELIGMTVLAIFDNVGE